ncbi:hypothetical protein J7E93_12470 [Streptomyces sp. ISL-36]|uniref:hypothetical protein n=1 Tax=Streptomyces sp. ISL-36 TaxID=2819182 RepID=UPI001BED2995|nr:hypothetical protein [Streptomyces sp. ISL-36]MBT2440912.1 hypothetical protein [Streptomyces sp. ISL-36]
MRRRTRIAAAGATAVAAAAVTATVLTATNLMNATSNGPAVGQHRPGDGVVLGEAADHLPSTTAVDWVTYADHVVVVSAVAERRIPPSRQELDRGEGVIGRQVTLKIDKVLWSRDGAARPAPKTWDYNAFGWQFTGGAVDAPRKMAMHERPRVEPGHSYIMAMVWEEARCAPGDAPEPARWRGLGEGSEIPYDAGIIGNGELEGRTHKTAKARKAPAPAQASASAAGVNAADAALEERLAGQAADLLAAELKAARPTAKKQFAASARAAADGC